MEPALNRRALIVLILGDGLILLAVTLIGFSSHGETLAGARWLTTFLPLSFAWGVSAPWFGLFRLPITQRPQQIWRVFWAVSLAAPLATLLRAVWLNTSVIPVFTGVILVISALGLGLWRLIYAFWLSRRL